VKIAHLADCHLGYSAYNKVDERTGLNVRELDFYQAFLWTIDKIRSLEPDVVVLAGDLFHVRRPAASAIVYAQSALSTLDCPIILIPGNHDNATHREPSPLVALKVISNVIVIDNPQLIYLKGSSFYCVPYTASIPEFKEADYLVAHLKDNRVFQFKNSPIRIPESKYKLGFLGDFHVPFGVAANLFYSGALERTSFNQLDSPCGFMFWQGTEREFIEVPTRKFVEISSPPADLEELRGAVVSCVVKTLVDQDWISDVKRVSLFTKVKVLEREEVLDGSSASFKISSVLDSFREFCQINRSVYSKEVIDLATSALEKELEEA